MHISYSVVSVVIKHQHFSAPRETLDRFQREQSYPACCIGHYRESRGPDAHDDPTTDCTGAQRSLDQGPSSPRHAATSLPTRTVRTINPRSPTLSLASSPPSYATIAPPNPRTIANAPVRYSAPTRSLSTSSVLPSLVLSPPILKSSSTSCVSSSKPVFPQVSSLSSTRSFTAMSDSSASSHPSMPPAPPLREPSDVQVPRSESAEL